MIIFSSLKSDFYQNWGLKFSPQKPAGFRAYHPRASSGPGLPKMASNGRALGPSPKPAHHYLAVSALTNRNSQILNKMASLDFVDVSKDRNSNVWKFFSFYKKEELAKCKTCDVVLKCVQLQLYST